MSRKSVHVKGSRSRSGSFIRSETGVFGESNLMTPGIVYSLDYEFPLEEDAPDAHLYYRDFDTDPLDDYEKQNKPRAMRFMRTGRENRLFVSEDSDSEDHFCLFVMNPYDQTFGSVTAPTFNRDPFLGVYPTENLVENDFPRDVAIFEIGNYDGTPVFPFIQDYGQRIENLLNGYYYSLLDDIIILGIIYYRIWRSRFLGFMIGWEGTYDDVVQPYYSEHWFAVTQRGNLTQPIINPQNQNIPIACDYDPKYKRLYVSYEDVNIGPNTYEFAYFDDVMLEDPPSNRTILVNSQTTSTRSIDCDPETGRVYYIRWTSGVNDEAVIVCYDPAGGFTAIKTVNFDPPSKRGNSSCVRYSNTTGRVYYYVYNEGSGKICSCLPDGTDEQVWMDFGDREVHCFEVIE